MFKDCQEEWAQMNVEIRCCLNLWEIFSLSGMLAVAGGKYGSLHEQMAL